MKMKIALFQNNKFSFKTVFETNDDGSCWADTNHEYTRISENLEVEFKEIDQGIVLADKLKAIDEQERKANEAYALQLAGIAAARAALSAGGCMSQQNDGGQKHLDANWFARGELPPVGAVCQFFSGGYDSDWFDWCIFHGLASCGGFIVEHHHRTSPEMVTVDLFDPALTKFRPIRIERQAPQPRQER